MRLAKQLEHDSTRLLSQLDLGRMDHIEIMNILKNYYAEVLKGTQSRIDRDGAFSKELVDNIQLNLNQWNEVVEKDVDDFSELLGAC